MRKSIVVEGGCAWYVSFIHSCIQVFILQGTWYMAVNKRGPVLTVEG